MLRAYTYKLLPALVALNAAMPSAGAQQLPDDLSLSLTASSDYKLHGLSQTENRPALRFAVDYEHASGFFAGGFITNVEYESEAQRRRERELQVDYYAGYSWRADDWATSFAVSRYVYPDIDFRYDYTVAIANASYRDRYFASVSYTNNLLSVDRTARQYQLGVSVPWVWGLEFGANAGRFESQEFFSTEYSYWDAGFSKIVDRFAIDLRLFGNSANFAPGPQYQFVKLLGEPDGERWVLSVAYAIAPRGR